MRDQGASELTGLVLHPGRHLGVHRADHEPVAFQLTQRESEAAAGLGLIQVGAISLHLSRGEARLIGLNIAPLALAGAAIWLSATWL